MMQALMHPMCSDLYWVRAIDNNFLSHSQNVSQIEIHKTIFQASDNSRGEGRDFVPQNVYCFANLQVSVPFFYVFSLSSHCKIRNVIKKIFLINTSNLFFIYSIL